MGATKVKGTKAQRAAAITARTPVLQLYPDGSPVSSMEMAVGQEVAWVMKDKAGITVGVSAVHRVFDRTRTYCGRALPAFVNQLPPLQSLNVCSSCQRMHQRCVEREAAEAKRLGIGA